MAGIFTETEESKMSCCHLGTIRDSLSNDTGRCLDNGGWDKTKDVAMDGWMDQASNIFRMTNLPPPERFNWSSGPTGPRRICLFCF